MNATAARIASSCLLLRSRRLSRVITRIYVEGKHGLQYRAGVQFTQADQAAIEAFIIMRADV